ncbi:MAG: InlB B-repeat-containing protein [Bacillales bacterium]|nr:InlB B-repeat-containing protein [Bacillales bacterium]
MSKNEQKRRTIIEIIGCFILLAVIIFLVFFLNRKYEVSFYLDNGSDVQVVYVKHNKILNLSNIKGKEDLGESFVDWYEIVEVKDGKDILADKPFDFNTKIDKDIKLKALYEGKVETITITFDSKGGSAVDSITINKGAELILPKDPTYAGYTFKGWYDINETPIHNNVLLAEDTTLYAKWEKIPEPKKEEKISLSLSRNTLHVNGIKTATATARVENSSGKVTFSLSDTNCMTINKNTGAINVVSNPRNCSNGATITVTAKTPSGKSATAIIYYEKDLVLTYDNRNYTQDDETIGRNPTFTVNANQNVSWDIDAAVKPSYRYTYNDYKNRTAKSVTGGYNIDAIVESTGATSKISTDVKVTATTNAKQKISLIIKNYVA